MNDARQAAPCRVETCGGLHIEVAGEPVVLTRVQKIGELIALLCCHINRPFNREEIAERLWPGVDPKAGRSRLRFTLTCLRKYLEPAGVPRGSVLIAGRNHIAVSSATLSSDVSDFSYALHRAAVATDPESKAAALRTATQAYGGDFMAGYYTDWIEAERERLNSVYADAICELAITLETLGDLAGAHEAATRAVATDPWREEAHRCLLRVHIARGETAEAIRHYARLKRSLAEELGVEPAPETRAIVSGMPIRRTAALRDSDSKSRRPRAARAPREQDTTSLAHDVETPERPPRSGRLPEFFTRFLGRERELAEIAGLLADKSNGLVTLTGLGGIGKTRLAVEAGRQFSAIGPLVYVDLLVTSDPEMVLEAIASACGIRTLPGFTTLEMLAAYFANERRLLLLDNCEHLLPQVAAIVQLLLTEAPRLSFLATSRIPLDIPGETQCPVGPLPVPTGGEQEDVIAWDSVKLFVQRARLVRPGFAVTKRNAADVAEICRTLEGIPLAVELAAAWSGSLRPSQMKDRLSGVLDLLVSHKAGFQERHRTLRSVLDQSYSLLPDEAKKVFLRLSVFRSTWSAQSARSVCGPDTPKWLEHLRRCSLVSVQRATAQTRFRMLEPVREYAWGQLSEEQRAEAATRHAEVFRDFGQTARDYLDGPEADQWLDRLSVSEPNLIAAVDWCLGDQKLPETGVGVAEALRGYWEMRGYQAARCRWLLDLLTKVPADDPAVRGRALGAASYMARLQGDYRQAFALLGQAVTLFRESGDDLRLGFNLCLLGQLAQHLGESASALELHAESLAILRRISHAWGIAMVQSSTGKMLAYQGKLDQARPVVLESLETYQRMGDKTATATVMSIAAMVLFFQGNLDAAMAVEQESLGIRREINRPWGIAYSQISIGRIAFYQGDLDNCVASIREGLATYETIGDLWGIAFGYHCLGMTARRTGDVAASHRLQDALRFREHVGIPAEIAETLEAIALGVEEADPASAVSLIAAAATIRERAGAPVPIVEQPQLTEAAVALRSGLGDAKFKRAYERGRGFSTGEAVAFGLGVGENFKDSRTRA